MSSAGSSSNWIELEAQRVCPAGVQPWNRHVVAANEAWVAYIATLTVYVFRVEGYAFERLINAHDINITSIAFAPLHQNILSTSSDDCSIIIWDVSEGNKLATLNHKSRVKYANWCHRVSKMAFIDLHGTAYLWQGFEGWTSQGRTARLKTGSTCTQLAWHCHKSEFLALGQSNGKITIMESRDKKLCDLSHASVSGEPVREMQWDTRSFTYLLTVYSNGDIVLWDTETATIMQTYCWPRKQILGVASLSWIHGQPGTFVTVDAKGGRLREWNASQKESISQKYIVSGSGLDERRELMSVCPMDFADGAHKLFCAFLDGAVGVYNFRSKRLDFLGFEGHRETIFGVEFNSADPDILATGSFDGTVKVWNYHTMALSFTLEQGSIVYDISFSPCGKKLVAVGEHGKVCIWNIDTVHEGVRGEIVSNKHPFTTKLYKCDWNKLDPERILVGGEGVGVGLLNATGEVVKSFPHPDNVYGVCWHPSDPELFATGCWDCKIRVFNAHDNSPSFVFDGHSSRVFNVAWSSLNHSLLASGSDDRTIRIWEVDSASCCAVLVGHTDNVRALTWCKEIPCLLYSGSWDATIRVWDVCKATCIAVVNDHYADVYNIAICEHRPFNLVSCSRDSTLRMWNVGGRLKWKIIGDTIQHGPKARGSITHPNDAILCLCGLASKRTLEGKLRGSGPFLSGISLLAILELLHSGEGFSELLDILRLVYTKIGGDLADEDGCTSQTLSCEHGQESFKSRIPYPEVALRTHLQNAKELKQSAMMRTFVGVGEMNSRDKLLLAASKYLRAGQVKSACETLVLAGEWQRALSLAPGHSLEYWTQLSMKYATSLEKEESPHAIEYCVAAGRFDRAQDLLLKSDAWYDAVLLATSMVGRDVTHPTERSDDDSNGSRGRPVALKRLQEAMNPLADFHTLRGEHLLSAACYLAVEDFDGALNALMEGRQFFVAFTLATLLRDYVRGNCDEIVFSFAKELYSAGHGELSETIINRCSSRAPYYLRELKQIPEEKVADAPDFKSSETDQMRRK